MQTASHFEKADVAVNTKWFKDRLQEKQITQRKVAATLDVDPSSVSLMLRGERRIQLNEAEQLARLIGQPIDAVLTNLGVDPSAGASARMVPIAGFINGDNEVVMKRPSEGPRLVEAPPGVPEGTVALRYRTATSQLESRDGWIVFYAPSREVDIDCIGRWCISKVAGRGIHSRVLKRGYARNSYNLVTHHSGLSSLENVAVEWASPVLWVKTGA